MKRRTRKKFEMVQRAVVFVRDHGDDTAGGHAAALKLEALATEADGIAVAEMQGRLEFHSATERKRGIRRTLRRSLLPHVAGTAKLAAEAAPGIAEKFIVPRGSQSDAALLSIGRTIYAEALANKEMLVKCGLSDTVMEALDESLKDLAAAIDIGARSRQAHVGANDKADALAAEIALVVKVFDTLNRHRFADDSQLMGEWKSASNVVPTSPRSTHEAPAGQQDGPAKTAA